MFGDYIDRGSAGAIFSSPTNPDQVIKIINLDSLDDFTKSMNNQQFKFFEKLEEQQKQGIKTPGLPKIEYTFTGEMTPEIMDQIREAVLNHSEDYKDVDTDEYLSGLNYAAIKGNFRYGDKYAIILMDRISQIGSNYEYTESIGRRGLTPMLRHAHSMGYYVRDLWPANKGMSSDGNIIWFDPMVAPVNPITEEDRKAQRLLLDWNEETQRQYREAVRDQSYFDYEHQAGLFYSESEDDNYWLRGGCGKAAAMISKDLDQKNIPYHYEIGLAYTEEVFIGNHIVVISEKGDQDHYGTQGAKKRWENMLISELVDQELPPSMLEDIITFKWHSVDPKEDWSVKISGEYLPVSGPMITKDTLGMSAEDENRYHDCANCNRKNVDNEESDEDDACHMCGNYFCYQCMNDGHIHIFSLDDHDDDYIQETYFGGSSPSVGKCCLQKAIGLGFRMYSGYGKNGDWLERLVEEGYLPNQSYVSINYVLGGVEKMSAEDENRYHDCANCNRKNVDTNAEEALEDSGCSMCGNYFCAQCMAGKGPMDCPTFDLNDHDDDYIQETYFGKYSPVIGKCCLQKATDLGFKIYSGYGGIERLVEEGYLPHQSYVSINYVLGGVKKMSAESYPTCYLCAKPAKIEVMTAIGMRSFCGNKCRGDYEGIDYGPDDYFISPKLEHQLEVISYKPGYQERNYSEDATIKIKCKNCDYESIELQQINSSNEYSYNKPASFYRIHPTNTLKVYPDEEDPEYFELVDCNHDMKIINQLVVGEDAWGNMISGEITVRCSKCRFADILRTDLSDGCNNKGRIDNYIRMPK